MLVQLSNNIVTCRQEKGSALVSRASPLAVAQPSQYPGPFSCLAQAGRPASSTLLPPASVHSQPAGASEHSENGGFSPAASRHTRRSQGKVPPRQSSVDERSASQWQPSDRSSPAEDLGQPERSLWRSVVEHQATGLDLYREKPQGAWGGASLLEKASEHAPLHKLEVPESSSWLALHQVMLLLPPGSCISSISWMPSAAFQVLLCSTSPALCGLLYEPPFSAGAQVHAASGRNSWARVHDKILHIAKVRTGVMVDDS